MFSSQAQPWYIPNMKKIHVHFSHSVWVGLNNQTKIINEFPPFNYLTVKTGLGFNLFSARRLEVNKTDPGSIGSGCKCVRCFHCYPQVYYNTTSCPCLCFRKKWQVHFKLYGTQDIMKIHMYPF